MANSYLDTYRAIGNREDLLNTITMISYRETVVMSRLGTSNATNTKHEWLTQALQASNSGNAVVEGASAAFATGDITVRARLNNYTQILRKSFSESYSQDAMDAAGVSGTDFENQRTLKTIEVTRDANAALINQTSATGDSATARTMHGIIAAITTNTSDGTGLKLDQNIFNAHLQTIWSNSGRPNAVFCHGYNKRMISSWATPSTPRVVDQDAKKITASVDVYDSDFGRLMVLLERELLPAVGTVLILQEQYWKKAYLRPLFYEELGKQGGSRRAYVETELTLEYLAENSSGKITGLTTSS